jgi:NTE family protein
MSTTIGPTDLAKRIALLGGVRLFDDFTHAELEELAPRFSEAFHHKGEVLFREGDMGGDFFVVAHGELEVLGGATTKCVVNRLGAGDHLGEIALLLGGRRTATVRVSRAARLLVLSAAQFHEHLEHNPKVLAVIARDLASQLDARTRGEIAQRKTLTIGITAAGGLKGKTLISNTIAILLERQLGSPVRVISRPDLPDDSLSPKTLTGAIEKAQNGHAVIVLDLGSYEDVAPALLAEVCDTVVEVVAGGGIHASERYGPSTRLMPVVNLHNARSRPFAVNRCEPFLLRDDPVLHDLAPTDAARFLADHPRSPAGPAVHRLARKVRGASVGIALAGGAAFGISHLGVLQVLEDAGIPVDMVTGTSMGSIVGALYATGLPAGELSQTVIRKATPRLALSAVDPAVSRPSLLAGRRLTAILRDLGLTGRFEDLALPYQAMATDIETGERVPIATGELAEACRASASIPAIFAPVRRDGRVLVDGGVVDQVPTELIRQMGADVCIAVTVIPTLQKGVRTVFTRVSDGVNAFNPMSYLTGSRGLPTTIDLVINALQMLQYQLGSYEALAADARLEVDTSDFTWVDFHRAADLIERGRSTAARALPEIQRVLAARPALAG